MTLPKTLVEVTPRWLTGELASRFSGVEVDAFELEEVMRGAPTKAKLRLCFANGFEGAPEAMSLKAGMEAHSGYFATLGTFEQEAMFYRDLRDRPEAVNAAVNARFGSTVMDHDSLSLLLG